MEERRRVEVRRDGLMSDADEAIESSEQRRIAQICAARQRDEAADDAAKNCGASQVGEFSIS